MSGHGTPSPLLVLLAARWKAVLALVVPMVGGLVALAPDSRAAQVIGVVITALVAGGVVHQVPNQDLSPQPVDGPVDEIND